MKNILRILVLVSIFFIGTVYASNDVDYKLTITKDYNFNEEINFSLSDYKAKNGGNNPFFMIVNDDVYSDIAYQNKYKKKKYKSGNKYIVKLTNTYSEYGMGNANYLNNCFEDSNYDYDMDKITFTGSKFICTDADSLKITIITDFEVTENNASSVNGNKYTWNANSSDFNMNISLNKTYEQKSSSGATDEEMDTMDLEEDEDVNEEENANEEKEPEKESSFNPLMIGIIIGIVFILGFIIFVFLHAKSSRINKI